jgi:hypothetical protein
MRPVPPQAGFFALLMAGVMVLTSPFFPSFSWFVCIFLAALTGITLWLTRQWPDRAFYLICAGQPAAIACGMTSIWAGLVVEVMLAGMVAGTLGHFSSGQDYRYLLLYAGLALLLALLAGSSNHVFPLLLTLGAALALLAGIMAVRGYQFRKECTGARS